MRTAGLQARRAGSSFAAEGRREGGRQPVWRFGDLDLFSDSLINSILVRRNEEVKGRGLEPDRVGSTLTSSTYQLRDLGQLI